MHVFHIVSHAAVTCLSHDRCHSYLLRGKHTDKDYMYDIGICVEPKPITQPGCAVIQTDMEKGNSSAYCIGNLTQSQVARSKPDRIPRL